MPDQFRRDRFQRRLSALKLERESFDAHYKSLAQFVSPRRGRFQRNERNKGGRTFWNQIINSQATWAHRVATAGMFNGIMSPSRPWLMLETNDADLLEFGPVKEWFYLVQEAMRRIFNAGNLYNMAPVMISEEILFGTGCMSHVDDPQHLARFYAHTVGSYFIAQDDRFVVSTIAREFERTVEQIVSQFSRSGEVNPKISPAVRRQYDLGNYDSWHPVVQFVEPNRDFRPGSLRLRDRAFRSVHYEPGNADKNAFLLESGFDEFPFYCPRWQLTNEDVYGTNCPGMTALGDVRQLQLQERRKAQGIDKMVAPPLHGPAILRNQAVSSLPTGSTFYDAPGQQNVLRPIYEVKLPIGELSQDMDRVEGRINRDFFVDLFLAISAMEGVQPRNQLELTQRNNERLLQLGPTLERQFGEFLDPMVARTFNQMIRVSFDVRGELLPDALIPPPPPALQGRPLRARYISTLAMAQQAIATGNIDRLVGFAAGMAQAGWPEALEKVDALQAVDEYGTLIGSPPRIIRSDDDVARREEARAQQEQQAANLERAQQVADVAETAGGTTMEEGSVLGQAVRNVGGNPGS